MQLGPFTSKIHTEELIELLDLWQYPPGVQAQLTKLVQANAKSITGPHLFRYYNPRPSKVAAAECAMAGFIGTKYCLAVNSCTSALITALRALGAYANVFAIAVSGSTLYLGGQFTTINDSTRYRAAAVGADGAVLGQWPTAYVPAVTPPVVPPVVPPVAPPVVARVLPAAPTKLHWLVGDGTTNQPIVTTFTAAPGTTYTISGTLATSKAFGTRASKPTRGTCKITTNKKTNKRTAKCTIPLRKAGTWLVSITPAQAGVKGPPATKTIKIRAATKKTRTLPIYQRGILAQP